MKIITRTKDNYIADIIIESGNLKIVEDLVIYKDKTWQVPECEIESLITAANDFSRFNKVSDIEFVKLIFDNFLSDSEQKEFVDNFLNSETL